MKTDEPRLGDGSRPALREARVFIAIVVGLQIVFTSCVAYLSTHGHDSSKRTTFAGGLLFLCVFIPALTGIVMAAVGGKTALLDLLRRVTRWRVHPKWYAVSILGVPAMTLTIVVFEQVYGAAAHVTGAPLLHPVTSFSDWAQHTFHAWPVLLATTAPSLALVTLGEEIGWRGYLLPRMLKFMTPATAAVTLGTIWSLWHVPAWFIVGEGFEMHHLLSFFIALISFSIVMTWIFIHTGGSALVAGLLPHMAINSAEYSGLWNWNNNASVPALCFCALILLYLYGRSLSSRQTATTERAVTPAVSRAADVLHSRT